MKIVGTRGPRFMGLGCSLVARFSFGHYDNLVTRLAWISSGGTRDLEYGFLFARPGGAIFRNGRPHGKS
jgi:hypothetical protein